MRRALTGAALTATLLIAAAGPAAAEEHDGARVHLIHGIPDVDVDVAVDGENVIEGFTFSDTEDLSDFAGETLANVEVKVAGSDDVAIDAGDVDIPAEGNYTAIAHLDAEGTPMLSVFENDTTPTAAGEGRLVVRHAAAAPPVDVWADGDAAFTDLANPDETAADLPDGTISAEVVPAGESEPVVIGPADLDVVEGSSLIVYAVGSLDDDTVQPLTETIEGLSSPPDAVHTGVGAVAGDSSSDQPWALFAALAFGLTALGGTGLLMARRHPATLRNRTDT